MAGPRQTQPTRIEIAPGLYTESTDSGAPGRWKDGDNIRFTGQMPEKIGGSQYQTLAFADGTSTEIMGHVRAVLDWTALDGTRYVAIGTECKLYLITADFAVYDITPIRRQANLTNPFSMTSGSATVRVTDASHGAQDYDRVRFSDATAAGGITINGEYAITAVIDSDTYEITHSSAASSTTTGGGPAVARYDIACGPDDDGTLATGYGTGTYGSEYYGLAMEETSTFTIPARVWSLDKFGEDLLASPRGETLYWWDASTGVNSRAVVVATAPQAIESFLMSQSEVHAIALGATEVTSDNQDKMLVRWCDANDFFNWEPALTDSDVSNAGFARPNVGSYMVTGLRTDTLIVLWSDQAMFRMDYVGSPRVFEINQVGENVQILGPNCAAEVNGRVIFMGRDNFHIYDGTLRILECDIWTKVFRDLNRDQSSKPYAWVNTNFSEVWFHYPSEQSLENDRTAIYNYRLNVWYYNTCAREAGARAGAFGYPCAFGLGELYLHEVGYNDGSEDDSMWSWIEHYDAELADGGYDTLLHDLHPDMDEITGTLNVYVRTKQRPNSVDSIEKGPFTVTVTTDIIHPRSRGGVLALRFESTEIDDYWRLGPPRARFGPYGRR